MPAFFHNRIVKIIGVIIICFLIFLILAAVILASLSDARSGSSTGFSSDFAGYNAPSMSRSGVGLDAEMAMYESDYLPPQPTPSGYTAGLETYETTSYSVSARTKDFDAACASLTRLKADDDIHFKTINASTNNCRATFYVTEDKVDSTLNTLTAFRGVEVSRDTSSVTRHRQQIESQTSIIQQQLALTERTLTAAEAQINRLNTLLATSDQAGRLSDDVLETLRYIDTLTQRKINYLNQLNNLYQQAADLEERTQVVQFDVNLTRAIPLNVDQYERKWDAAWKELKDTFTDTLIGLTAFFGIFLLWIVRVVLYLLVTLIIVRGLWKFVQLLWKRW